MIYENVLPAVFLNRPNRFIAHVELKSRTEVCHVKNTADAGNCWFRAAGCMCNISRPLPERRPMT